MLEKLNRDMIWRIASVTSVALLLLAAVVWAKNSTPKTATCPSIEYIIEDKAQRQYVTDEELTQLLTDSAIFPADKPVREVSVYQIEKTIRNHPMVLTAECYMTLQHEVKVHLTQRTPILRIQSQDTLYLVDMERQIMPDRPSVTDSLLTFRGLISEQMAVAELADMALWIQKDAFWNERIESIEVEQPDMLFVHLRGSDQPKVILGEIERFEQKMGKLKTFLDKGKESTEGKQYKELDLRFHGQVVARK